MRAFLVVGLCAAMTAPVLAQTGTFAGTVARDSVGTAVGQAEVQLPQLNRATATNYLGEFQFKNIPPGRYAVTVRAVGFQPFIDSIDIKPGAKVDGDIVLTAMPVSLEAQRTTAAGVAKRLPPGLQEMEDRRKANLGGYFVTDSVLRANDERKLTYFLAKVSGLSQVLAINSSAVFVATGRSPLDAHGISDGTFPAGKCYVDVYLNGGKFFIGPATPSNPPPDFSSMWGKEYSGIEFYPGGSSVPAQYNSTGGGCGTMLLWTRR